MENIDESKYVPSKLSISIEKENEDELIYKKNNYLENFLDNYKDIIPEYLSSSQWDKIKDGYTLKTFLESSKHLTTYNHDYGMDKNFIYKCLKNYNLLGLNEEDVLIIKKKYFSNIESSYDNTDFKVIDSDDDDDDYERVSFNNNDDDDKSNDIIIIDDDNNSYKQPDIILSQSNTKLDSFIESSYLERQRNKYKKNDSDTLSIVKQKKKQFESLFVENFINLDIAEKKIVLIKFMEKNNIKGFMPSFFDILDDNNKKIFSDEYIETWYLKIKKLEDKRLNVCDPSLLIMMSFFWMIEWVSQKLNIPELEGLAKNIDPSLLPRELMPTKNFLDQFITDKIPENPLINIFLYIGGIYTQKKIGINFMKLGNFI